MKGYVNMRQPKWTIDEVILGVNTFFEIGDVRQIVIDNPLVVELSETLRKLQIHKKCDETFRNLAGVRMTLFCIASLDNKSAYSMRAYTKLQKQVYDYYFDKKLELEKISLAIRNCLPLPFSYYEPINAECFIGGNILFLYHLYLENQTKQAQFIKRDIKNRGKSRCSVCGVDLQDKYGCYGVDLLELHYNEEVSNFRNSMAILPGKFVPICPSCHKISHKKPDWLLIDNLKTAIIGS